MKKRLISLSCWVGAIVATYGVACVAKVYGFFEVFAIVSILWAAFDSRRVRLWRYYSGLSGGPTAVLVLLLILGWPIVFPWYLGIRLKIWAGVARLRDEYQPWQMSDPKVGPNGLLQPWRGRRL